MDGQIIKSQRAKVLVPVSYTHLDVYKRQAQSPLPKKASPSSANRRAGLSRPPSLGGSMKQERKFPAVTVTRKAENSIRQGHPWVYREEFTAVSGEPEQGGVCDVFSQKGAWLGAGFYSAASKIGLRILSDNANEMCIRDRHRRHHRLGAGPLPARRARPAHVRRRALLRGR